MFVLLQQRDMYILKVQFKFKQQYVNSELIFRYSDHIEFGLWIVRYSCSLLLLIMGFWGPGLNKNLYHLLTDVESVSKEQILLDLCRKCKYYSNY